MMDSRTPRPSRLPGIVLVSLALVLVAYTFWPERQPAGTAPAIAMPTPEVSDASASRQPLPPGAVSNVGGIPLDANGERILSSAGLPLSEEPLPIAKAIPIKAQTGAVIGYATDAQGNSQPIRAGSLTQVPNTPGSFAVVDMWADGGPTVVPATEGKHLTQAELARLRAGEDARDRASRPQP